MTIGSGTITVATPASGASVTTGTTDFSITVGTGIDSLYGNVITGNHTVAVTQASAGASAAGSVAGAVSLTGATSTLDYSVDGTEHTVSLNTADADIADVVSDINGAGDANVAANGVVASEDGSGDLVLTTYDQGSAQSLQVLSGSANTALGLTAQAIATFGTNALVSVDGVANTVTDVPGAGGTVALQAADGRSLVATVGAGGLRLGSLTATQAYATPDALNYSVTAATAVSQAQAAISTVSSMQGTYGAYQNQLQDISGNETVGIQNLTASNANIEDTNMASQMVHFTQDQVLVQAGVSMLAQANQIPQYVLKLLG